MKLLVLTAIAVVLTVATLLPMAEGCCHGSNCNIFACNCGRCNPSEGYPMTYWGCGWFGCPSGCGVYPGCGAPCYYPNQQNCVRTRTLRPGMQNVTFSIASPEEEAKKTFSMIDGDGDGKISKAEATAFLTAQANLTAGDAGTKFDELDKNKDGQVAPAEFDSLLANANMATASSATKRTLGGGAGAAELNGTVVGMPCEEKCQMACTGMLGKFVTDGQCTGSSEAKVTDFCKKNCGETCNKQKQNRILPLVAFGYGLYELFTYPHGTLAG